MRASLQGMLTVALVAVCAASAQATLIQVGTGGTTNPTTGSSGTLVTDSIAVTLNQSAFAAVGLWDSASGTVGGGSIGGDLWYAFSATALDYQGNTNLPDPAASGVPAPGNGFGGGETVRSNSVVDCLGQACGWWAQSYTIGTPGTSSDLHDMSPRYDLSPNRVATWVVHVAYGANATDSISLSADIYDNGSTTKTVTLTGGSSGYDFSFDAFKFASGMFDGNANRWKFSNVAFATTEADALAGIAIPEPTSIVMLSLAISGFMAYAWRKRK